MKSKKLLVSSILSLLIIGGLASCGESATKEKIVVWVGEESSKFYQDVCNEYLEANPDFGFNIEVKPIDTGSAAGTIIQDPSAAGDIFTVAHDNIGKLAAKQCAKPIVDEALTKQILDDNPESFKNVIYSKLQDTTYLYAAPYISQALFLYYNKSYVSAEQAKSFEGLMEAATNAGTKAWTVTGDDGYNNSFSLLATKVSDHSTSLKIYEGASDKNKGTSNCQGDDTIAILRYVQDAKENVNGFKWASPDGWDADLRNNSVLSVIGGAWHYNTAAAAVGESNLGITLIPTITLTESNVNGLTSVSAGDIYRGGTFADCKVFMINATSSASKYTAEQQLIKYLTSKDIQNRSFKECSNVPSYVGGSEYIASLYDQNEITENQYKLASTQVEMAEWGIPQPFITETLNTYFYSKNAPQIYKAMIDKTAYPTTGDKILDETSSLNGIRKGLYAMEHIWMRGKTPSEFPETLPTSAAK